MADPTPHRAASSSVDTAPPTGSSASTEQQPVSHLMEPRQQASADPKQSLLDHDGNWDDYRGYMQAKRRKLHDQFQDTGGAARQSSIFSGVTIYVNGWTLPDADELKRLMHAHGGNYEYHPYSGTRITHVVATNLPNAKVRTLGDTLVCTPQWIVDSVAAGKQLPVHEYLLYSRDGAGQRRLNFERCLQQKNGQKEDDGGSITDALEQTPPLPAHAAELLLEPITCNDGVRDGARTSTEQTASQTSPPPPFVSVSEHPKHSSSAPFPRAMPYKPARGTDFVSEFYTHSRLHHLSMWSSELKLFTSRTLPHVKPKYPKLPDVASMRSIGRRAVVHVDLDCFFVSVSIRDKPHLRGRPVAVAHAKLPKNSGAERLANPLPNASLAVAANRVDTDPDMNQNATLSEQQFSTADSSTSSNCVPLPHHLLESMSDVASCSYEARGAGVCNGMQVGTALKRCPDLTILPYQFEHYRQVSQEFYETMMRYSAVIEAVSCDEAYIELTDYADGIEEVERIVRELRDEVRDKTGCTVSAGISHNMLLARMCTRVAKPDGQFRLSPDGVDDFLVPQKVRNLPGVGYSLGRRLQEMGLQTCGDIRTLSLAKLQSECGVKTGQMLHDYARGVDNRELNIVAERKSLSADINYGIRFSDVSEAESLIGNLAAEVEKRAEEAGVLAGTITLKLKIRRQDAPVEARKYLGHGSCDNTSRSCTLLQPTRTSSEIARIANKLLKQIKPVASDIRGVGLQLTKLVSSEVESQPSSVHPLGTDLRVLFKGKENARSTEPPLPSLAVQPIERGLHPTQAPQQGSSKTSRSSGATPGATLPPPPHSEMDESFAVELPPASQLDSSVLEALPASLRRRILNGYQQQMMPPSSSDLPALKVTAAGSQREVTFDPIHPLPEVKTFHPPPVVHIHVGASETTPAYRELTSGLLHSKPKGVPTGDESTFLSEHRAYLKDWVAHFSDGPRDSDVQKVVVYFTDLARRNLEVVNVLLKYFRRLVLNSDLCRWYSIFNFLLQKLQAEIRRQYGGTLSVNEI